MSDLVPVLLGTGGLCHGEVFVFEGYADVVIGRSRACDVSFQRFHRFLALTEAERLECSFLEGAVSRHHLRMQVRGTVLRIENLSTSGTYVVWKLNNGMVRRARLEIGVAPDWVEEIDLTHGPVELRLGNAVETFRIGLQERAEALNLLAAVAPIVEPERRSVIDEEATRKHVRLRRTPEPSPVADLVDCQICGAGNPPDAEQCLACGEALGASSPGEDAGDFDAVDGEEDDADAAAQAADAADVEGAQTIADAEVLESPSVTFPTPDGPLTQVFPFGEELLSFLENAGASCASRGCGMGICHTCMVRVASGREHVRKFIDYDESGLEPDQILACGSTVTGPVVIEGG